MAKNIDDANSVVNRRKAKMDREEETPKLTKSNSAAAREKNNLLMLEHQHGGNVKMLVVCFVGIFVSYFIYALLQEKITKRKFGDEYFRYFMFLVGIQCIVNAAFAKLVCKFRGLEVSLSPYQLFALLSFVYVGAMVASNSSLAYISYPSQVLGKSAKPIPILIFGVLLGHRSYPILKYFIVVVIVIGVALFLYQDNGTTQQDNGKQWRLFHFVGIGELLVFLSLTFDGLTGVFQDKLKAKHSVHALYMMYAVNVYAAVYLAIGLVVTGEGVEAVGFVQRHPTVLFNILVFGIASAIGQNFIFTTINNFGPLTCSIFTTTRKFFTILGSVLIFSNPLQGRQWLGVALVFFGLGLDMYFGRPAKSNMKNNSVAPSSTV